MPVGILRVIHTLAIRWTDAFGENLEGRRQCRRFKCIEAWAVAVSAHCYHAVAADHQIV